MLEQIYFFFSNLWMLLSSEFYIDQNVYWAYIEHNVCMASIQSYAHFICRVQFQFQHNKSDYPTNIPTPVAHFATVTATHSSINLALSRSLSRINHWTSARTQTHRHWLLFQHTRTHTQKTHVHRKRFMATRGVFCRTHHTHEHTRVRDRIVSLLQGLVVRAPALVRCKISSRLHHNMFERKKNYRVDK